MMQMSYSQLRQHLKLAIKTAASNHEPMVITSHDKPTEPPYRSRTSFGVFYPR